MADLQKKKKRSISKVIKTKRINYAEKYEINNIKFWKNVLFTDESKFEIFGSKKILKKSAKNKRKRKKEQNIQ